MIRQLLEWHMSQINAGVKYTGVTNCHVPGLHSVVLQDNGQGLMRLYYADETHNLHQNDSGASTPFSLAIHGHRQDLTFIGVGGDAQTNTYAFSEAPSGKWHEMAYKSALLEGEGEMVPTGRRANAWHVEQSHLAKNDRVSLPHWKEHSVWAPPGRAASWLVLEGPAVLRTPGNCWRNTLDPVDWSELYQPMGPADILNVLEAARDL